MVNSTDPQGFADGQVRKASEDNKPTCASGYIHTTTSQMSQDRVTVPEPAQERYARISPGESPSESPPSAEHKAGPAGHSDPLESGEQRGQQQTRFRPWFYAPLILFPFLCVH